MSLGETPLEDPTAAAGQAVGARPTVEEAVLAGIPAAVSDLSRLVRIPSVSWGAFDPAHVAASAEAVAELFRGTGVFDSVDIRRSLMAASDDLGHPAVIATRPARNGKPTVLLYAHHDVQPPGDDAGWDSPPYEPTVRGDRLYGRGASDDKAGVMTHVAAVRALAESTGGDFDLGLAVFIEGEEEYGSKSFAAFLEDNREVLAADVIIVADSDNWDIDTPAVTVALRGNVAFRLTVRTLEHASHSGMYGGAAPDAMLAAIRLLDSFWDADGAVAVEGLESAGLDVPEFSEDDLRRDAGFVAGVLPLGRGPVLSRLWAQPAITITGIDAPTVENASNTLVPEVTVKVSARIAPGQTAADAFAALQAHVEAHRPFGAETRIWDVDLGNPFLVDTSGWAIDELKAAMRDGWGREAVETGIGGSIPFIADLVRVFPAAQILVTGVEDPDTRAHSPNESQHLGVLKRSILTEALFLQRLDGRS